MTHYLSELAKMPRNYAVSFQVWNIISFWTCFILKACFAATQAGSFLFNSPSSSSKNLFHCCLLTVRSTSVSEGYFKTDPNYSSLENTTFIRLTLQALLWIFLMGAKPGRNKRGVTQKGNAGNGKDQMSHASIIFSSFWHKKNPHLHYCWSQL